MNNLLYRNQDNGMRKIDEIFMCLFLGVAVALLLCAFSISSLRSELTTIKLDKRVVALDREDYQRIMGENAYKRLYDNLKK
jgi:hypothetical protein